MASVNRPIQFFRGVLCAQSHWLSIVREVAIGVNGRHCGGGVAAGAVGVAVPAMDGSSLTAGGGNRCGVHGVGAWLLEFFRRGGHDSLGTGF